MQGFGRDLRRNLWRGVGRSVRRSDAGWWVAALLPLAGILLMLGRGVIDSADGPYHVHRIQAMAILLRHGDLWPRWVSYFHVGFGYPVFNYYPPGASYLGGLLVLLGMSAADAFTLLAAAAWIVSSVGVYGLARELMPPPAALLAAALVSYAPATLHEIWHQGGLAQMIAMALVPWFLRGVVRAARSPVPLRALEIALPVAGIALAHIPTTYLTALYGLPVVIAAPLVAGRAGAMRRRCAVVGGGIALGAGLAAIFLLPLVLELHYIRGSSETAETVSFLEARFLRPDDLFAAVHPTDFTNMMPTPQITLGLVPGAFALAGAAVLLGRRRGGLATLLIAGVALTAFMALAPSLDVWLALPYLQQLRFVERFLRIGAIPLALLGGASLLALPDRWRTPALGPALAAVVIAALPLVYGTGRFVRMDDLTALDEITFELETHVWGTTSYDEYDPVWGDRIPLPGEIADPDAYTRDPLRVVVYPLDAIRAFPDLIAEQTGTRTVRVTLTEPRAVRFQQYYFPGWRATLDGVPVDVYAGDDMGLLTVDVPAGTHTIALHYAGTPAQHAATAITLLSVALAVGLVVFGARKRYSGAYGNTPLRARAALVIAGAAIAFALVNTYVIEPRTGWFRHVSRPDAPAYMQTRVGVTFGETWELLGYTLDDTTAAPGESLDITLYWRRVGPLAGRHVPRVQIVNPDIDAAWASSEHGFPQNGAHFTPDRFASDVHRLALFDDAPQGNGLITVQVIDTASGEPLRLPDGADRAFLPVTVRVR